MAENTIKCTVLPGHEVNDGKPHQPGETIILSVSEADRLTKGGYVKHAKASTGKQTKE